MIPAESHAISSHVISIHMQRMGRKHVYIHRKIAGRIAATATRRRPRQPGWSAKRDILRIGRRSLRAPSKRKMTVPVGISLALGSDLRSFVDINHPRLIDDCDYEMFANIAKRAFDSAKSRHPPWRWWRRWLGVVLVIGNLSSRKKGGDHTQPPEVFGDRHGCRRRTDDMGDRAERKRDREPSARRLGLKLTESALLVPGRSAAAPHRGEGSRGRRRGRKTGWEGERRRKSENDVVERDEGEEGLGPYHRGPLQSTHRVPRASTIIS